MLKSEIFTSWMSRAFFVFEFRFSYFLPDLRVEELTIIMTVLVSWQEFQRNSRHVCSKNVITGDILEVKGKGKGISRPYSCG